MKKKLSKKQITFVLVAICLVGLIGIGISYSYYLANISTSNEENKSTDISTLGITSVVMDMQGKVSSDGAYPGHKMVKEVVVRGIGSEGATPANASIQITPDLGMFASDVTWKLYKSDSAITCSSVEHTDGREYYEESTCNIPVSASLVLQGSSDSDYLNIVVSPNTETKYYLVIEYLNKTDEDQSSQMGKSFSIDIGLGEKVLTPLEKIIASVDTTGKCPSINADGTVNVTSAESTDGYLCSAEDNYGTSYYYRGNVTNNYVKFGSWSTELVYGYESDTSSIYDDFEKYDSIEACQNSSYYNKKCTVIREKNTPIYWRIIRYNGDGSVRVIYDGTTAHANDEKSTDRQIGTSSFNLNWQKDNIRDSNSTYVNLDNSGVGYMYGNADTVAEPTSYYPNIMYITSTSTYYIAKEYTFNTSTRKFTLKNPIAVLGSSITNDYVGYYIMQSSSSDASQGYVWKIFEVTSGSSSSSIKYGYVQYGTSSKEVAQTSTNSSTIKTYLDNWYQNNILGTNNEKYLNDNIFCNDRSFSPNNTGTGAGMSYTDYRWSYFNSASSKSTLKCLQQNDAFTVNDVSKGNGALTYPIGLVTTDEVVLAGGYNVNNSNYYLYSGSWYWTSSADDFDDSGASEICVSDYGRASGNLGVYNSGSGVRPVLNLSPEVLKLGDGTMDNPYHVE